MSKVEDATVVNKPRALAQWTAIICGVFLGASFVISTVIAIIQDPTLHTLIVKHFPAVVGLPCAALTSVGLVITLESTSGSIEFEGLGFKFRGASGPIVLWCMCFLGIAGAIKLLW